MTVRVRYAPSPTGYQHIGGARTALFNYFFARANGGKFIIRLEDTDQERTFPEAIDDLYATLNWLGINYDEGPNKDGGYGPYIQSQRLDLYQKHAKELVEKGKAYYCYCTPARLERIRKIQEANGMAPGYDRHCRDLTAEEIAQAKADGITPVVRLLIPLEVTVTVHDEVMGDFSYVGKDISPDPVLLKSDGFPTYHLANVIDDHAMAITHIMRAQEWIPSAPFHKLLYEAFGWQMPKLCHLPMVMGNDNHKLSKRHGATSVREFVAKGYLPQAIINYISLLGWSYDDSREFFTMDELCQFFTMERINKAPAVFDYKKLEWFNGQYMRKLSDDELKTLLKPFLVAAGLITNQPDSQTEKLLDKIMPLIKERLTLLSEAPALVKFFFARPASYNIEEAIAKKSDKATTLKALQAARPLIEDFAGKDEATNEAAFRALADELGIKINMLLQPLRVAVTGSSVSPPLFPSIYLLGTAEVLARVDDLIKLFNE
ncbi:MAG: glutamate--tRNA ligase [Spirochaetaceae bacterium]|nr:glutamate--tRNA ligase [Spirochaetaceae bacterium]